MKVKDLIQLRLVNQGLTSAEFATCADVVSHFGAMQAQDYGMAKWAVGMRMRKASELAIEHASDAAEIVRTHILRPTWHFVDNKDIRWMMELSASNVKKSTQYINRQVGLTDALFKKVWTILERELTLEDNLTKEELVDKLDKKKINVESLLATQILIRAELEMRVCNGVRKGKQFTYSLFDRRIPAADKISKGDALVKLAGIYFQSRGPATAKDFMWWSGMNLADAKLGIGSLGKKLVSTSVDGLDYLYFEPGDYSTKKVSALLPAYDEFMVGYSEGRDIAFPPGVNKSVLGNGIFKALVLADNTVVGTWKKVNKKPGIEFQFLAGHKMNTRLNEVVGTHNLFRET